MTQTIDPHAPLIDPETGLEYENFLDWLAGRAVECARNTTICLIQYNTFLQTDQRARHEAIRRQYRYRNRNGDYYAAGTAPRYPQGIEHFLPRVPGSPEGAGEPDALQASPDPVHPADQPPVHGRVGP